MSKKMKDILVKIAAVAVAVLILVVYFILTGDPESYADKYQGQDLTPTTNIGRDDTYAVYQEAYKDVASASSVVPVDIFNPSASEGAEIAENYEGEGKALLTAEKGYVDFVLEIPETGMYNIYIEYFPIESRGIDIERSFLIYNEETDTFESPFSGCDALTFSRIWTDQAGDAKFDNQGNQIRPTQVEAPRWEGSYFKDYMGYETEPYQYYFEQGSVTVRLEGVNEPMAIRLMELRPVRELIDYNQYLAAVDKNQFANKDNAYMQVIQGEDAEFRSSPSLYATYDRSSPNTEPYSVTNTIYNMIGGTAWRIAGQWIEWEIEVPEDGLYEITIKGRQNYNRGFVSNRSLTIDGEIPFEEVSAIGFSFTKDWEMMTLSDANGNPYQFALTAGKHTIRLEVTLGDLGDMLQTMEESVARLNQVYRKIIILTGTEPDKYRDYDIDKVYPDVIEAMELESKILYRTIDQLIAYSGEKGSQVAAAETLAKQLERFVEKPSRITKTLTNFKDNISALGTSVLTLSEAQLDIDYIIVSASEAKLPTVKNSFFASAVHEIRSFIASFTEDYNSLGDVYEGEDALEVWILTGRDQSTILKTMVDDTFTPNSGIKVNVKLVAMDALMPAVVAGTGPDVVISVNQGDPVNYAIRGASYDLTQFDDLDEVIQNYYDSALVPYRYNGGLYALPETQNYNVMFYRTDILEELGIEPPKTWDDLIAILPTIQNANMNVGIPSVERKINNVSNPDLSSFFALMYQNGGTLYNEEGSEVLLDEEVAVKAFETYTKFFTHYKTPTEYDFVNRFRTGEMPLGMVDYNTYNTLSVSAPEIRGLWKFTVVPGTVQEDGSIDHSTGCWGTATMMLANCSNPDAAWAFMKWWMTTETQVRYGRELEAVMGAAARYATANREAFLQLAWSSDERDALLEQWQYVKCNPEVPGGYYTSRHITNAIRKVINKSEDSRETLLDYTRTINDELKKKRIEFGLE